MPKSHKQIRVVGYIRESTKEQGLRGYRPETQRKRIEKYCKKHDFCIINWFQDFGSGGGVKMRPSFLEMMSFVKENEVRFIVIHGTNRFFRNIYETLNFEKDLEKNGIFAIDTEIDHYPTDYLQGRIPTAVWTPRMHARIQAEAERRNLQDITGDGYKEKRERGQYIGPLCFGVEWLDENKKYIRFKPKEGEIVKEIFKLYLTGNYGFTALSTYLNKKGYFQKKPKKIPVKKDNSNYFQYRKYKSAFTNDVVRSILTNKTYIGFQNTGKHLHLQTLAENGYETPIVPLIDEDTFNKAQEQMSLNKRGKPNVKTQKTSRQKRTYLLQGLIKCAENGSSMYGCAEKLKEGEVRRYACSSNKSGVGKRIPSIRADVVERKIIELLKEIRIKSIPEIEDELRKIIKTNVKTLKKRVSSADIVQEKLRLLKMLETRLQTNYDWATQEMYKNVQLELDEIAEKQRSEKDEIDVRYYSLLELRRILSNISAEFHELQDLSAKEEIIQILFKEVCIAKVDYKKHMSSTGVVVLPEMIEKAKKEALEAQKPAQRLKVLLQRYVPYVFEDIYVSGEKEANVRKVMFKPTGLFLLLVDDKKETPSASGKPGSLSSGKFLYRNSLISLPAHQNLFANFPYP